MPDTPMPDEIEDIELDAELSDDIRYHARAGELAELRDALSTAAKAIHLPEPLVIELAYDPDNGNTALHMVAANGNIEILSFLLRTLHLPCDPSPSAAASAQSVTASTPAQTVPATLAAIQAPASTPSPPGSDVGMAEDGPSSDAPTADAEMPAPSPPYNPNSSPPDYTYILGLVNDAGNTALHWAAVNGQAAAVRLLLRAGAEPSVENDAGLDALEEAGNAGKDEVVAVLSEWMRIGDWAMVEKADEGEGKSEKKGKDEKKEEEKKEKEKEKEEGQESAEAMDEGQGSSAAKGKGKAVSSTGKGKGKATAKGKAAAKGKATAKGKGKGKAKA